MVKTHLPAHMDSVRQTLRPKHQLLVLKCYPRLPKNSAADVKPNGSELSYLLYYASTRRSKLQKVGSFLEKKTASDVYRWQSARVLVTLQILAALLENKAVGAGSGFALIAPHVLRIIREILQNTNDISLIEASLATWDVFCRHQDQATLKADHEYRELYEDVVRRYANFARRDGGKKLGKSTSTVAVQDAIRLREAGLGAIKSILLSDALASESGRQLDVLVPAILSNIRGEDDLYLMHLARLQKETEDDEKVQALARRQSMVAPRMNTGLTDISAETDPRQAEGTAQDADELAEEETAVLALECLIAVFANDNRGQIRIGASAVLKYLVDLQYKPSTRLSEKPVPGYRANSWATKLFEICTAWTPVQDRFILMVTAVETLVRLPVTEASMEQQLLYTDLIGHILRSDLNLIGLSVMDILLGLIQQILRVLQLSGPRVAGRSSAAQIFSSQEDLKHPTSPATSQSMNDAPSEARLRLTERLKGCIADLATHVYYTDQIADMISAILFRLKPNPAPTGQQNPLVTAAAIQEPKEAVTEVASNVSLPARERSNSMTGGFFSFDTARQVALDAVKDVLHVANSSRSLNVGGVAESRNKVPISIWEGTQWLLRDPAPAVRRTYVDALATWLQLETKKSDARIKEPKNKLKKKDGALARRALSNASKDKQSKKATSTFLQLLHLAIFENALQYAAEAHGEKDILILHFLLLKLIQRLGVNAVQSGLPMIFALQEEIPRSVSLNAGIGIGSLVHGYLWALAEVFDFEASPIGQDIFKEIKRRQEHNLWITDISVPCRTLDQIRARSSASTVPVASADENEVNLIPFDHREGLVDRISDHYALSAITSTPSAPGSPGRSPGRTFTSPTLDRNASNYLSAKQPPTANTILPDKVKTAMLDVWTKEGCLAAIAAAAPKSASYTASHSSPSHVLATGNHRQLLSAANAPQGRNPSPNRNQTAQQARQQAFGPTLDSQSPDGRPSGSINGPSSSAGVRNTIRVDDLKRVLAGGAITTAYTRFTNGRDGEDTASESMIDVEGEDLGSESGGFATPPQSQAELASVPETIAEDAPAQMYAVYGDAIGSSSPEAPTGLQLPSGNTNTMTDGHLPSTMPKAEKAIVANGGTSTKSPPNRGGASIRSRKAAHSRKDLTALLASIGTEDGERQEMATLSGMRRPGH